MPEIEEIVGSGGALLSRPDWAQILADVLELPVTLSAADEASARGAAVAALAPARGRAPAAPARA